ncbi:MAG: T9SS type A sorting domain-containing protein [Saprospiraceae bacterium]
MSYIKSIIILITLGFFVPVIAQHNWLGKLHLSDLDCESRIAKYTLSIKGVDNESWALGDQNYRLFFDASLLSVQSIQTLLPENLYSVPKLDEILEIVGQGQESFSPLDEIDSHLGFLDFSVIAYNKQKPEAMPQIQVEGYTPIVEIVLDVSADLFEVEAQRSVKIYFSRPETAGQITNQYSVISAITAPNQTMSTQPVIFIDINETSGLDAQLATACGLVNDTKDLALEDLFQLYPNPIGGQQPLRYQLNDTVNTPHTINIYGIDGQLVKSYPELPAFNSIITLPNKITSGVYFVELTTEQYQLRQELIVVRQ